MRSNIRNNKLLLILLALFTTLMIMGIMSSSIVSFVTLIGGAGNLALLYEFNESTFKTAIRKKEVIMINLVPISVFYITYIAFIGIHGDTFMSVTTDILLRARIDILIFSFVGQFISLKFIIKALIDNELQ